MSLRNIIYIIVTVFILISVFFLFKPEEDNISNFPNDRTGIVMFGDSLVSGKGSSAGNSLPEKLGRKIDQPVLNLGVPGNTSVNGLKNVDEIPKDARLVIINLGGNDALKKIPEEVTENAIRSIISQVQQNGSIAMIISVRNGLLFGNFDYNYQKIADETGSLYMSDILKDIFGDEKYMSDQIHPNDLGYSIIADRIAEIIEDYI